MLVIMTASNVWVCHEQKEPRSSRRTTYIRGSEITEVRVSSVTLSSYGKEVVKSDVRVERGDDRGSVELWEFDDPVDAAHAAQTLLAALAADPCGVVVRDDRGRIGVRPLPAVDTD